MINSKIKWSVGLSDGSNYHEDKELTNEGLSAWQKLLKHINNKKLIITSLSLCMQERRWNLPSAGNNPKFKDFDQDKPTGYRCFRKVGMDILNGIPENKTEYVVIEAEYPKYKLQTWVLDKEPFPSWSSVIWKT